jgi:hypothetical protein
MNVFKPVGVLLLLGLATIGGCSRERARAVAVPADGADGAQKDYRAMLDRIRTRQTAEANMAEIELARDRFLRERGRLPSNLVELVHLKYLVAMPQAPKGEEFLYDAVNGNIQLQPVSQPGDSVPAEP